MKVSAALQILTTVMSSGGQDEWSQPHVQSGDVLARATLDLGACLDVESLEELSQNLYSDADTQPSDAETAWAENVIDMTSSEELTSSGDHAGVVPTSDTFSFARTLSAGGSLVDFGNVDSLVASDNATFAPLQIMVDVNSDPGAVLDADFSQLSALRSATPVTSSVTPSTAGLTTLEELMTVDVDATSQSQSQSQTQASLDGCNSSGGTGGNIPSNVWNLDLTFASSSSFSSAPSAGDQSVPTTSKPDVKQSLKTRLYSRGSVASTSQDNDLMGCSTRSLSSSTSSLTQSLELDEDDPDALTQYLEKREKNRLAAQKCRNKKRDKTESLQKDVTRLEERQEKLKEEVQKLRDERETLEEIIHVHGMVCPKIRKTSNS